MSTLAKAGVRVWEDQAPSGPRPESTGPPRTVVLVVYDGAELVDIASVTSAFELASRLGADPGYSVRVASVDGADITCTTGLVLRVRESLADLADPDTLMITGGWGHVAATQDAELVRQVRRLAARARRMVSVCTGTFLLAEAGLLDGRRVTTHWRYAADLASRYPEVQVDADPVYIRDGRLSTSGGVTASLDLTLALIEDDHGPEVARWVAMGMVTYLHRPGNQAQMSIFTVSPRSDDAILRELIDHIVAHPDADLSVAALAARGNVSPRHLTRLFRQQRGEAPAAVVRRIRVELAARMLASTDLPLPTVARRCGFSSVETLRQAFVSRYEISPRTFRRTVRSPGAPPADQNGHAQGDGEAGDTEG